MIRMIQSSSASHAKAYFSEALTKSDYYLDDQELQGRFLGRLSDRLGMEKNATKDNFFALCENVSPVTGEQLTPRTKEDRTVGYDINFHCPKSVSILHALSKDDHIIEAFRSSVDQTMKDIEADSMTRVRVNGVYDDRQTGELVWAEFTHQTARPVDGSAPDPHLHSHCFVFNATWDEQEKKIKAGQFKDIKRDMPFYQARFHKILSDKLTDIGYQIKRTDKSFEIEGVPKSVVDMFSKRTNEIGEFAKEHGITDAKQLGELGARTRSKKQKGTSMDELKTEWRRQIKENATYEDGEQNKPIRYAPAKLPVQEKANDCVDHALKHTFERVSVIGDRRILATAYRQSIGTRNISMDDITHEFKNHADIIHIKEKNRSFCTTKEVLAEEKKMVDLARKGQGRFTPLYNKVPKMKLKDEQAEAVQHILTTKNHVSIIRGGAGTGKTTLLQEADRLIKEAGKEPLYVAPSAQASRGVLVAEGFENANTVSKLLVDKKMQESLKGQILIVDEAGLLGTKDTTSLLELTERLNARLILVGDTRQHSSVVRGDALRVLNTVGGIKTAEVSRIYRQRNVEYRSAVEHLSKGNVTQGFEKLDAMGAVKTVDPLKPNDDLVNDYIKTVKKGKSALIVSPTNKQGETVSKAVREKLRSVGMIGKREIKATKITNINLTEAQKSDWRNFSKGNVIQFNQNVPKIKRGSTWSVFEASKEAIKIKNDKGDERTLPKDKANAYDVCIQSEISLSKGDKIRITRNRFDKQNKRFDNGDHLEVVSVNKAGKIFLTNPASKATFEIDKDFGYLDYSYCTTSHSSQGKTVDEVFIAQPASTFSATDAKQFYVSVSRGRDAATIYTDDKDALLEHASEIGDRQSALEFLDKNGVHREYVLHKEKDAYENRNVSKKVKNNKDINRTDFDRDYEPRL